MGEVRKRKTSGEKNGANGAAEAAPVVQKSGGLGLIPVVLISALLAGSGCHVIRKDTAKSIADLNAFIGELKTKNVETGELVEKLRSTVATKDALIESLKQSINANEKQAQETDQKMEKILDEMAKTEAASANRSQKIADLESQLSASHTDAAEKLAKLNAIVDNLPQEIQSDLGKQGAEISSVASKLASLESRVNEQGTKIEANAASATAKDEFDSFNTKLASLSTQVESAKNELVQLSSKMPSQVAMEKMSIQSEKAVQGLETANELLDKHAKEINTLKSAGEKELGNLDQKVASLTESSSDSAKKVASLEESIKSTKRLVDALDEEVTSLKKRHAESVAAQN